MTTGYTQKSWSWLLTGVAVPSRTIFAGEAVAALNFYLWIVKGAKK
jgi:hypothetical protein